MVSRCEVAASNWPAPAKLAMKERVFAGESVPVQTPSSPAVRTAATLLSGSRRSLIGASRGIASEVARLGIRVNVVAPGLIATDMTKDLQLPNIKSLIPMARVGRPEEVATVVRFLCSEDAAYITGQVITVNGGMC